ncbi:MAG: hypothetical protein OHK0048_14260 [Rhodoferax sp.]
MATPNYGYEKRQKELAKKKKKEEKLKEKARRKAHDGSFADIGAADTHEPLEPPAAP